MINIGFGSLICLTSIAVILLAGALFLLWALKVLPVIALLKPVFKKFLISDQLANSGHEYEWYKEGRRLTWGTSRRGKLSYEYVIFSTVKGTHMQLSNYINIPFQFMFRGKLIISIGAHMFRNMSNRKT